MNPALEKLKDIHLPAPEVWWHIAWGWWLVLVFLLLCCVMVWRNVSHLRAWQGKRRAKHGLQQDVCNELTKMRAVYEKNKDSLFLLREISVFLRRVSVTVFGQSDSAGLIQDEWLEFLDQQWGDEAVAEGFSGEINANLLKYGTYQHNIDENMRLNIENMLILAEKWADKVLKNHV